MCFQLLNVTSPNAPENTCVISIFEAPDSYTNLKIALSRHIDDIVTLERQTWRYHNCKLDVQCLLQNFFRGKKIRVFLSGDYEFLCRICGLSGASGT